jgi:hypothetical protein
MRNSFRRFSVLLLMAGILFTGFNVAFAQPIPRLKQKTLPQQKYNEFQFIAYYFNKSVLNNIFAQNPFLTGQTIGRLFGSNSTSTKKTESFYFEQRLLPFFIYQPKLLNGKAILRASFEIDWTWGDQSYGTGGNSGSAVSADQVNIQTQNVELELIPAPGFAINLGLQRLFDTPYNPYRTLFNTMTYTGYRLAFWGTDAVGLTLRLDRDFSRYKLGYYQLYENNINLKDDVVLWELMAEKDLTPTWRQGLSFWYVMDRANGAGGVSILGQGLNSPLNDYNGTARLPLGNTLANPYKADIYWIGTFWNRNPEFTLGRTAFSGFALTNRGQIEVKTSQEWMKKATVSGYSANLRSGYKYGQTDQDAVVLDVVFASGDKDTLKDEKYSGVITGNTWAAPGAIFISHGAYLLMPHGNVVNRFVGAVNDLSNLGLGYFGASLQVMKSLIPHKLAIKIGAATANSQYAPAFGGKHIGDELNAAVIYQPHVFMNLELHAAHLTLGDFYESNLVNGTKARSTDPPAKTPKPRNPWTVFLVFKWLMF